RPTRRHLHPFPTRRSSDLGAPSTELPDVRSGSEELRPAVKSMSVPTAAGDLPTSLDEDREQRQRSSRVEDADETALQQVQDVTSDRKSTRLNSSHRTSSYD